MIRLLCLLISVFSIEAYGWNFDEHVELGESSFQNACNFIEDVYGEAEAILENGLETTERFEALSTILSCSDDGTDARIYGLRSALSGDHVDDPQVFLNQSAETLALSWVNYGNLALSNADHFWPEVKRTWRHYHDLAVKFSISAYKNWASENYNKADEEIKSALAFSAFADHFLQDSFATGHLGFARSSTLQNPSLIFHDYWNAVGRVFSGNIISDSDH